MFTFILVLLTTTSALGSDFSCNFSKDECGWFLGGGQNCHWEIKREYSGIKKGYLVLVGAPRCSAPLAWSFDSNHVTNANDMTLEYFMTGPGPVSLSVANDEDGLNWSCTPVKPGNQKRMARARINHKAKYIYIKASVGPGSELVITQIWNSHLGAQAETVCPQITSRNTTATPESTEPFSPMESRASSTMQDLSDVTSKSPASVMNTTKPSYNLTTPKRSTGVHSTTQAPSLDNAWYKQLRMIFENIISTKNHSISLTGNITINLNIVAKMDNK